MPNFIPNKSKHMMVVEVLLFLMILSFCFSLLFLGIFYVCYPSLPNLFGNIVPPHAYFFPIIYILPTYICITLVCKCGLFLSFALIYGTVYYPLVVKEVQMGRRKYKASDSIRETKNLMLVYRMLQIIQARLNHLFGKCLVPMQALMTISFVFGGYMLIRFKSEVSLITILFMILSVLPSFLWSVLLYMGGHLHVTGRKIIMSWRYYRWSNSYDRKLMKKFRMSCRPIMICYGKMYILQRQSPLVFFRGLVRGLVRALLTLDTN